MRLRIWRWLVEVMERLEDVVVLFEPFPLERPGEELLRELLMVTVGMEEGEILWLWRCLRMQGERGVQWTVGR